MIKIEFPSENVELAKIFGEALLKYAGPDQYVVEDSPAPKEEEDPKESPEVERSAVASVFEEKYEEEEPEPAPAPEPKERPRMESSLPKHDAQNVPFDEEFTDGDVFRSGARKGQWKKRKGVRQADFDSWYNSFFTNSQPTGGAESVIDPAQAFQPKSAQPGLPKNAQELIQWVSEVQVSGKITAQQIQASYSACGISVRDLFPPTDPEKIAENVGNLYEYLKSLINE